MHGRITIETSGAVPTVVKRATGTRQRARLAHEASLLADLRHPGVVRLVEYRPGVDHDELVTEFAGAVTMADHRPADVTAVAGLGAAISDTVADLHASGIVHGALQPDHVLLGSRRQPVLCSLSAAVAEPDPPLNDDIAAVGRLVAEWLDGAPVGRGLRERRARADVAATAALALDGGVTARELAARLAAVPGASLGGAAEATASGDEQSEIDAEPGTRTWRHRVVADTSSIAVVVSRRARAVCAALGLLLVVGLLVGSSLQPSPAVDRDVLGAAGPTVVPALAAGPSSAVPPDRAVAPGAPQAANPLPATPCAPEPDVDGDGCADDTEVLGRLIRHRDTWYQVGDPGDVVILGHWACASRATPAVLRPSTGEVFVFDRWPTLGDPVTTTPARTVAPGTDVLVVGAEDGCDIPETEPRS
ncbi:MAG: hypothetical protein AAF480_11630 [Actinomycetota bacterium]